MSDGNRLAGFERKILHHCAMLIPQLGKSGIDAVIEDIALQQTDDLLSGMNPNRFSQFAEKIIDKNREARDVIHVRVRHDNVAYGLALSLGQRESYAARIHRHPIVNQKAGQPLRRRRSAGRVK
jgi:hypothetical protein